TKNKPLNYHTHRSPYTSSHWDGHLARAAANYATDRMQKEFRGLLALKEDVPEPDEDAGGVTPLQKRKRLDELEIIAEDLVLTLTAEERTFFGAMAEGSGSINSGVELDERLGQELLVRKLKLDVSVKEQALLLDNQELRFKEQQPLLQNFYQDTQTNGKNLHRQSQPMGWDPLPLYESKNQDLLPMYQGPLPKQKVSSAKGQPTSDCSKDVINTLAKAHIRVSYDSTLAAV
ncbi:hypothetical protein BGZ96_005679, partial [Linnemannia gamsii]